METFVDSRYAHDAGRADEIRGVVARIGTLKEAPKSWKDVFFPEAHNLEGS